jgi:hypothetical protein
MKLILIASLKIIVFIAEKKDIDILNYCFLRSLRKEFDYGGSPIS